MAVDLILTRAIGSVPPVGLGPRYGIHSVSAATGEGFDFLDAFYASQKFPPRWAADMLDRGGEAVVVVRGLSPIASAWVMRKPMRVDEIRRTFDPGPGADYYLGDFVSPEFRGQGLQRVLIRARLAMSSRAGRDWAIAMTRDTIAASLANYAAEGFRTAAEFRTRRLMGFDFDHVRRVVPELPCGTILRH